MEGRGVDRTDGCCLLLPHASTACYCHILLLPATATSYYCLLLPHATIACSHPAFTRAATACMMPLWQHFFCGCVRAPEALACIRTLYPDLCLLLPATACYCLQAPEAIIGAGSECKKLTSSLDIYAFGIMMYEVYVGQPAYQGRGGQDNVWHQVCYNNLRPSWVAGVPTEYRWAGGRAGHGRSGQGRARWGWVGLR